MFCLPGSSQFGWSDSVKKPPLASSPSRTPRRWQFLRRLPCLHAVEAHTLIATRGTFAIRDAKARASDRQRQTAGTRCMAMPFGPLPCTHGLRNGQNVVATSGHRELFAVSKERRFDYFPGVAHEPWREIRNMSIPVLAAETDLLLYYSTPGYIFTNKNNKKLADRLERGFRMALKDGSFDKLFYNHPEIKEALEQGNLKNRRMFKLNDPNLPRETPLNDKSSWYTP